MRSPIFLLLPLLAAAQTRQADVVVYGATSSGIAAAVQVVRLGKSAIIVDPGTHLGGLTTGGLGWTDIGNKQVIGGFALEFYRQVKQHYDNPASWKFQPRASYYQLRHAEINSADDAMWTFEPHVATAIYQAMLAQYKIPVVMKARLDLRPGKGVVKNGARITAIVMEDGRRYEGRMFIDATYEGDLMAKAGVRYTTGREANATYGEKYNGVEAAHRHLHQFPDGLRISAYVKPGDPASGLLPGIDATGPGVEGAGDKRIQTYCFRLCMTNAPENRLPIAKPAEYNERDFELLLRYAESGKYHPPTSKWDPLPNAKTDTNNHGAVSTDFIGMNWEYPDGDYSTREKIVRNHEIFTRGYLWTLQNHARVPEALRQWYRQWGWPKDEFPENDHFPTQLYIREARRMIGDVVMTENHVIARDVARDSVGMGAYGMDSHNVQRYITPEGYVRNEGNIQVGGFAPYPISYRSIVPRKGEAANLFVPVCLSASHIAYGSIRMEPVFMILGQSSAMAAVMAIDGNTDVQSVDYAALRKRLLDAGQILESPAATAPAALKLEGIVMDDAQAAKSGQWTPS
ncbi:MAG: putative xanthan lyase, partial [Candidatus Solibacter sp.]|nr:putative xanthan lyase [Candidatus Solibacter sp.]